MSCESQTTGTLRETGRRVTTPRVKIASALRHAGGHRTAEEIHALVLEHDPQAAISRATVYRTLETLGELRLVSEVDAGSGKTAYQWIDGETPHHHLLCKGCGAEHALGGALFDRLTAAIREDTGFEPFLDHTLITGLCRDCARAAAASDAQNYVQRQPAGTGGERCSNSA